jgi:hypothetical protein
VLLLWRVGDCHAGSDQVNDPADEPHGRPAPAALRGEAENTRTTETTPDPGGAGSPCLAAEDCSSGVCQGEGCDSSRPGRCAETNQMCTRDLRPYCGCDGETFSTSGSCPGRRYAHKGPCED